MSRCISLVTIVTALGCITGSAAVAQAPPSVAPLQSTFNLFPNPKFEACLEAISGVPPQATVTVKKGQLNDRLKIVISGIKSNLQFDLFTVQRSNLNSSGIVDPSFTGSFGLAWYQTDLQANQNGRGRAEIQTILIDQIFGFDADTGVALPPTNTFHVGFWFNNPNDAVPCGFDATMPTAFNGQHKAGPLAMISVPNATTGLGPLCPNFRTFLENMIPQQCVSGRAGV